MTKSFRAQDPRTRRRMLAVASMSFVLGTACTRLDKVYLNSTMGDAAVPEGDSQGGAVILVTQVEEDGDALSSGGAIQTDDSGTDCGTADVMDTGTARTPGLDAVGDSAGRVGLVDSGSGARTGAFRAGCALFMHLDELSWTGVAGEVLDDCGHNDGTAVRRIDSGSRLPRTSIAGYFAGAGVFDSANGCVQVPDDPSLRPKTQFTLAAWIFPTALDPGSNGILAKRDSYMDNNAYTMFLWSEDSVTYQLWADVGVERFHGNFAFSTNRWYQVAVVFDGSLPIGQRVRLYVDGILDGEFASQATTVPEFDSPLYVGCLPLSGPAQEFAGKIDEAALWTRALSADEVLTLYAGTGPL